ncbi:hypothetical protein RCL_jg12772.t1 [Rhizophagus clarus]|uniref:Uncharacterized protein n=1 Tax=Rhizophagus clarus TaxID=94130 RepID=A0A8H3QDW9_9GLOM|nr:hypothetical protein RCL_jg12772.t1 [Rhizophagus clarus]
MYRNVLPGEVVVCEQSAIAVTTYSGHGSGKVIPTTFLADTVVMPDPERATLVLVTGEVVVCEQNAIAVITITYSGHGSGKVIPTAFIGGYCGEVVVCERNAIAVTTYGGHGSGKVIPAAFMADAVVMPDPDDVP